MSTETWNKVWQTSAVEWDPLSQEIGDFKEKNILEAGAGTGRISLRMAIDGASLTLLDYSDKALEICRSFFSKHSISAKYVNADLTKPLPFEKNSFDIIWNAGVMEHFSVEEQVAMVRRFAPLCRELHTFVPFSGSIFYRFGKWAAENTGNWRYGDEIPSKSMEKAFESSGFHLVKEYCIAHKSSLDFLTFIPGGINIANFFFRFLQSLDKEEQKEILERSGGYLLYSKGIRK